MKTIKLSSKNQVVIPKEARLKLGIGGGDSLLVESITAERIVLKRAPTFQDLLGSVPGQPIDAVVRIRKLRDEWH